MKNKLAVLIVLALLTVSVAEAQTTAYNAGNRAFREMSYVEAVRSYEKYLASAKSGTEEHRLALTELALSYRKLQDYRQTERILGELIRGYESRLDSELLLYYAQALASNGKYREAQKFYSKYGELQKKDLRGGKFAVAYMDNSVFYRDSSLYQVSYLDAVNSRQSDFAPMYYEKGLVFVSAREETGAIKRVFMHNQTPFLDLFLYSDTAKLNFETRLNIKQNMATLSGSGKGVMIQKTIEESTDTLTSKEDYINEFSRGINSKYHEGPVSFFKDYKKVVFTRNNYLNGKAGRSSDGVNKLKLYSAEKKDSKWTNIKELPFNSDEYSCGHPALTPDNKKMYFVSDMKGGYGGTDIYVCEYRDGHWSQPVNLGREVNTEGNEMFPFADEYGNLYFASDGHPGLGGLDVFYIEIRDSHPYGEPENLGAPINSSRDDFAFITRGGRKSGYFSSNRKRGYSDDNIYYFTRGCKEFNLMVYDENTRQPLKDVEVRMVKNGVNQEVFYSDSDGKVKVCLETGSDFEFRTFKEGYESASTNFATFSKSIKSQTKVGLFLKPSPRPLVSGVVMTETDRQPVAGVQVTLENRADQSRETVITGLDGRYIFQPAKEGDYVVKASGQSYLSNNEPLKVTEKAKSVEKNFGMIAEGDIFRLDNIYYDYGKYDLRPEARKELDGRVVPLLKKYPGMRIEIRSHTDSRSDAEFNLQLSDDRASMVAAYLIMRGVEPERLEARGYGESQLLNECGDDSNCTEKQHQLNRRTEFKVLTTREVISRKD